MEIMFGQKGFAAVDLIDLNKFFETINYDLLLAKLHVYGSGKQALHTIYSYLSNRKQWIKINNVFSSWKDLI